MRSAWVKLLGHTILKWQRDDCLEMGAALAYYSLFSLFPIILVILSVVGFVIGPNTMAYNQIVRFAQEALPSDAFRVVQDALLQLHTGSTSASIIGFGILLFTASGFFGALSRAFDKIWHVKPRAEDGGGVTAIALNFLWKRIFAFLMVIGSAGLILVSLLSNIAIDALMRILGEFSERVDLVTINQVNLLPWFQAGISFLSLALVVMVLFNVLPSTRVAWGDVWLGGLLTALLWVLLQQLISNSVISLGSRFRSYGVVGGVMVLMLWIYLTSQIFFLGGEFTYVYAHMFGSRKQGKLGPRKPLETAPKNLQKNPKAKPEA
ncbi:YihY/virulence factor BrkB family protein [Pseudanabaena sp. FACHB-2040]|nr:YihY/virulence factor BrkB family protein [Pseudanabaena sp. FACHB-2040]MBD2257861.1 YihY/virulence factor BrkB family protein [Pseudanabaena sp. FACHB-2040]